MFQFTMPGNCWQNRTYCDNLGLYSNPNMFPVGNAWGTPMSGPISGYSSPMDSMFNMMLQMRQFDLMRNQMDLALISQGIEVDRDFESSSFFKSSGSGNGFNFFNSYKRRKVDNDGNPEIILDFGHGGKDPGAMSGNEKESYYVRLVGNDLMDELDDRGINYVTTEDNTESLSERKKFRNKFSDTPFLSIHMNKDNKSSTNGLETFYSAGDYNDRAFAKRIQNSLNGFYESDRGVKSDKLARRGGISVLKGESDEQACALVELGFISNKDDLDKVKDPDKRKEIVEALADAIEKQTKF